jgi:hypothetical protein
MKMKLFAVRATTLVLAVMILHPSNASATPFIFDGTTLSPVVDSNDAPGFHPTAINNAGELVGEAPGGSGRAFRRFSDGRFEPILPGASDVRASDINDSSVIVGWARPSTGGSNGFVYDAGNITTLAANITPFGINNSRDIVGSYATPRGENGFLYQNGVYTTINFAADSTRLLAINDHGQILGTDSGGNHYFIRGSGGVFSQFDLPCSGGGGAARGMNNSNQIIGDCATVTPGNFIAVGQVFIHDLNSGTTTFISDPAWNYHGLALSNNGLALVERDPSLVPEPSSLILLALGLVGIVGVTVGVYRSRFLGHARGYQG